jgi:hypothetical protein
MSYNARFSPNVRVEGFQDCVTEAESCCQRARVAAHHHRYEAARVLFATATALYRHAESLDGISYPSLERKVRDIEAELRSFPAYVRDDRDAANIAQANLKAGQKNKSSPV